MNLKIPFRPKVLLNSLGDFKTSRSVIASIEPKFGSKTRLDLDFEVFNMLDIEGKHCNSGKGMNDLEKHKEIFYFLHSLSKIYDFRTWIWKGPMY